jgi:hypothetical protein
VAVQTEEIVLSALTANSIEDATASASISSEPVCGNSICETGEGSTRTTPCSTTTDAGCSNYCAADCPSSGACPTTAVTGSATATVKCAGHGTCLGAEGRCQCDTGYEGASCATCSYGYAAVTSASGVQYCAPTAVRFGVPAALMSPPPPPAAAAPSNSSGTRLQASCLVSVLLAVASMYLGL